MKKSISLIFQQSFLFLFSITTFFCLYSCQKSPVSGPNTYDSRGSQVGYASWYGPGFHGKKTASGEIYNKNKLTAAHKTLPFGTRVRVSRVDNGKSVIVTINDRGPFIKGRIIDLSHKAGKALDLEQDGVIEVKTKVLREKRVAATAPRSGYPDEYWVQLGYFKVEQNAKDYIKTLKKSKITRNLKIIPASNNRHRVCAGPYLKKQTAEDTLKEVKSKGHDGLILQNLKK